MRAAGARSHDADLELLHVLPQVLPGVVPGWPAPVVRPPEATVRRAAERHGLAPLLDLVRPWPEGEVARREQLGRHLRALSDLARLGPQLDAAGVPWAVLKGPMLSVLAYPRPDLRSYVDLDVLVDAGRLDEVLDLLHGLGAQFVDHDWELLSHRRHGEVSLRLPGGTALDLHWHLLNRVALRRDFSVDPPGLLGRAVRRDLGGVPAYVLAADDVLVHLCLHGVLSGGHRLVWVLDVDRWVRSVAPSWPHVVQRAHEASAGLVVAVLLARARHLLGTPVPSSVLAALAPREPWRHAVRLLDVWVPPTGGADHRRSGRALIESTRTSSPASASCLARRLARMLARRAAAPPAPVDARPLSPSPARSAWTSAAARETASRQQTTKSALPR